MTMEMAPQRTINGTFGEIWIKDEKFGNCTKFQAKVTAEYQEIDIAGKLGKYQKLLGYSIAGTITLTKLDSSIADLVQDLWKQGMTPTFTIVAKLNDPAGYGAERVILNGVTFDEFTLMDFEQKNVKEEEVPFKAECYKYIDMIV